MNTKPFGGEDCTDHIIPSSEECRAAPLFRLVQFIKENRLRQLGPRLK